MIFRALCDYKVNLFLQQFKKFLRELSLQIFPTQKVTSYFSSFFFLQTSVSEVVKASLLGKG